MLPTPSGSKCASRQKIGTTGRAAFFLAAQLQAASRENAYVYGESTSGAWHLNTPRLVADATGTTVWRWDQAEPFGNNPANEDPDGNSVAFDLPLRLPGQRYDQETGLHYNFARDYAPDIGRYVQSDPIGLRGGLSTFLYVHGMPTWFVDPMGLAACSYKHVYRDPFDVVEYDNYRNERWRVPGIDNAQFAECILGLDLRKTSPVPTGLAILVCIVPSVTPGGSGYVLITSWDVFLQSQRVWRTEEWCEEGCPPKEVFKRIVRLGIEKIGKRRHVGTDWDWEWISNEGGSFPDPLGQ